MAGGRTGSRRSRTEAWVSEGEHPEIDYVIIYMRSRAFRNYTDAAITKRQLAAMNVKLISTKEDFGEGYVADAMEGIIDIFNEMEVRRNGEDIKAKLRNKAMNGGTITRAKLGYLNTRETVEGRLFNSIGIDERRAPLVRTVFELHPTGEHSIALLEATMADTQSLLRIAISAAVGARHPPRTPSNAT